MTHPSTDPSTDPMTRPSTDPMTRPSHQPSHQPIALLKRIDHSTLTLSGLRNRTLILSGAYLSHQTLELLDCHSSYIYVLAPLRCVQVRRCVGTTLLLGAVGGVLSMHDCKSSLVLATRFEPNQFRTVYLICHTSHAS